MKTKRNIEKKSITNNFIFNLIYSIFSILIPIITTPYISRVFSAGGIGDYSYTSAILTYFTLVAALGSTSYSKREIAFRQDNQDLRDSFFWEIFLLRVLLVFIATIIYFIMVFLSSEYQFLFLVQYFSLFAIAIDISWLFQGMENFQIIAVRDMVIRIIATCVIFIFIRNKTDVWKYALINSLATFFSAVYMWKYVPIFINKKKISFSSVLKHIRPCLRLFIPLVAINIYTMIDKVMIKNMTNNIQVGYYTQAEKIIKLILTVLTTIGTIMLPRISYLFAKKNFIEIKKKLSESIQFVIFLAFPMMFGVISIADEFVPIFLGKGYDDVSGLMKILSLLFVFIGLSGNVGGPLLTPLKREGKYTIAVISGSFVNIILNFILIPKYNAAGAALSTVVAEGTVMMLSIIFTRDFINIKYLLRNICKYGFLSLVMFIIIRSIRCYIYSSYIYIIVSVLVGCTFYIFVLYILDDNMIKMIKNMIRKKIDSKLRKIIKIK